MNRTMLEKVRCMLFHAKLSKGFWTEAVKMAAFLANRSPNSALRLKNSGGHVVRVTGGLFRY